RIGGFILASGIALAAVRRLRNSVATLVLQQPQTPSWGFVDVIIILSALRPYLSLRIDSLAGRY
ncbi:MAG: hypothetical protein LBV04_07310, partial [Deferribacteraceae bacterium]|nr:hypothetical protein [Deferribacteraceae bacterium]